MAEGHRPANMSAPLPKGMTNEGLVDSRRRLPGRSPERTAGIRRQHLRIGRPARWLHGSSAFLMPTPGEGSCPA